MYDVEHKDGKRGWETGLQIIKEGGFLAVTMTDEFNKEFKEEGRPTDWPSGHHDDREEGGDDEENAGDKHDDENQ
ncbi:hypothetical protein LTS07_001540 [Exophiala sideris]|uniref:Uncharacterized protein n=1 Tax=Exophiala sideris TaxID=1016849 RepID=A0ABR0JNL0_9EURO|nr:hypothetical protein LTS07_001540 [Exophiala sideris]KAK5044054.1 hypothetical protein LTR13_000410 [Exophiala sideris]KAK5067554.1 hypothetical protein LTR69_001543 [Exophiala sideris]KAK5184207.1 hypothetical protein LTR44_003713 [Eurotiomycetes sp. CCFEE 6388]